MSRLVLNGINANNKNITNMADPSAATDAATKQYVDNKVLGLSWKSPVRAATVAAGTLASSFANGQVIDGVTLATGDRILLKDQAAGAENGIYTVNASGAPTRATDFDTSAEAVNNSTTLVQEGTVNGDKAFTLTNNGAITLGTTALTWAQLPGGSGSGYSTIQENGSGLTARTTLNFGTGLIATDNSGSGRTDVDIDTSIVPRKFAADCVVTTNPQTFTHNLNTLDVVVEVREVSSGNLVIADVTVSSVNAISVNFGGAPTAGQYRVVVVG